MYIVTDNFNAVCVRHIDPAKGGHRHQVVAEVAEDIDTRPVIERVCRVISSAIHHAAQIQH